MTGYTKKIDEHVIMHFRVNYKQLLIYYNKICEKIEKLSKYRIWKQTCLS